MLPSVLFENKLLFYKNEQMHKMIQRVHLFEIKHEYKKQNQNQIENQIKLFYVPYNF